MSADTIAPTKTEAVDWKSQLRAVLWLRPSAPFSVQSILREMGIYFLAASWAAVFALIIVGFAANFFMTSVVLLSALAACASLYRALSIRHHRQMKMLEEALTLVQIRAAAKGEERYEVFPGRWQFVATTLARMGYGAVDLKAEARAVVPEKSQQPKASSPDEKLQNASVPRRR